MIPCPEGRRSQYFHIVFLGRFQPVYYSNLIIAIPDFWTFQSFTRFLNESNPPDFWCCRTFAGNSISIVLPGLSWQKAVTGHSLTGNGAFSILNRPSASGKRLWARSKWLPPHQTARCLARVWLVTGTRHYDSSLCPKNLMIYLLFSLISIYNKQE